LFRPKRGRFVIFVAVVPTPEDVTHPSAGELSVFVCVMPGSCDLRVPTLVFEAFEGMGSTNCLRMCVFWVCSYLCDLFPFRLTGNKGSSSSMEESAGIIIPNTLEPQMKWLLHLRSSHLVHIYHQGPALGLFPFSRLRCIHTRLLASPTIADLLYIRRLSPNTRIFPPCPEPLTTHSRLLRPTTSLGPLRPFLFPVHSFSCSTRSLSALAPSKTVWLMRIIPLPLGGLLVVAYLALSPTLLAKRSRRLTSTRCVFPSPPVTGSEKNHSWRRSSTIRSTLSRLSSGIQTDRNRTKNAQRIASSRQAFPPNNSPVYPQPDSAFCLFFVYIRFTRRTKP